MNKREIKTRMLKVSDSDYVDATLPNLSSLWPHSFILAVLDLSLSLSLSLSLPCSRSKKRSKQAIA